MMVVTEPTDAEHGLMALQLAAKKAGPAAANALGDLLAQICANDAQAAERIGTMQRALETLQRCEVRMTDLETLVTGYRRRAIRLVAQVRARQRHDSWPLTDAAKELRGEEDRAVREAQRLEGWALHILTEGAVYPAACPPADWDSLRRVAAVVTVEMVTNRSVEVGHG